MIRLPKPQKLFFVIILIGSFFSHFPSPSLIISSVEFIGEATLPTGLSFQKTEVGGLSGITYDAKNNLYYAISDDTGRKAPPRFYTFKIDLSQGKLTDNGVTPVNVTNLLNTNNQPFLQNT
ncbi:MAG: esterase-like activity of phytase family protein, partial [Dolichospermum sp.]